MLFNSAFAQTATTAAPAMEAQSPLSSLLFLGMLFVVFYIFLIRPQQKRLKEHQNMISNLRRGDKVLTGGGIIGTIARILDNETVEVEIAPELKVKVARATITNVLNRTGNTQPSNENSKTEESEEKSAVKTPVKSAAKPTAKTAKTTKAKK